MPILITLNASHVYHNALIALIQPNVYHALVFKAHKTQDYKINYANVQYTAITMLCQHIKIANHVLLIPV
jgi:hypothetical protein